MALCLEYNFFQMSAMASLDYVPPKCVIFHNSGIQIELYLSNVMCYFVFDDRCGF